MQKKLRKVAFYPLQSGTGFIRDLQLQIIYAKMGNIDVYEVPNDPYAFEFEATAKQRALIQFTINKVIGEIMTYSKTYALYQLFINGLYMGNKQALEQPDIESKEKVA